MSDASTEQFSSFWPLFLLIIGLLGWSGYQDFATNAQRNIVLEHEQQYEQQLQAAGPTIDAAGKWKARYNAMMTDLVNISGKDPAAAAIAKDAIQAGYQAGLIRLKQGSDANTNSGGVPPK